MAIILCCFVPWLQARDVPSSCMDQMVSYICTSMAMFSSSFDSNTPTPFKVWLRKWIVSDASMPYSTPEY